MEAKQITTADFNRVIGFKKSTVELHRTQLNAAKRDIINDMVDILEQLTENGRHDFNPRYGRMPQIMDELGKNIEPPQNITSIRLNPENREEVQINIGGATMERGREWAVLKWNSAIREAHRFNPSELYDILTEQLSVKLGVK